jgi:hypothetical protein
MLSDGRDGSMNVILNVILSIKQLRVGNYGFFIGPGIEARFGLWRARYQIILGSLAGLNGLFKGIKTLSVNVGYLILGTSLNYDV